MLATYQPPGAFVSHLIKCGFKRYGPVETLGEFELHNLDLTSLKLDVGILTPFLTWKPLSGHQIVKSDQLAQVVDPLASITKVRQKKCFVLVIGGKLIRIDKEVLEDLRLLGVAVVDRVTIDSTFSTDDVGTKKQLLSGALVKSLGRDSLSPYVSGRPAIGGRFFGRSTLVGRLLRSDGSFTIVGNRRIGKTSLLKEIKERLKLQNTRTAEIYGATCSSVIDVAYKLLHDVGLGREAEQLLIYPRNVRNLPSHLHRLSTTQKKTIAIFVDEIDHILEFDSQHNYELLHLLRETCEGSQHCRVFLAGFRNVMKVAQSLTAPLFNFTTLIELPLFNEQESYEMVTVPLEHLGIPISKTDLPAVVYRETGGHPELIQIHCAEIVRLMQVTEQIPTESDLLGGVFNTAEYKQKVVRTFLVNTNPYEELLCYLLMSDAEQKGQTANYEFVPADVHRVLKPVGVSLEIAEIMGIISSLKASGIISPIPGTGERYRFCAPRIIDYSMGLKLEFCVEKALDRVKDQLYQAVAAKDYKLRKANPAWPEKRSEAEDRLEKLERAQSVTQAGVSVEQITHIYLMPGGSVLIREAEGIATLKGAIEPHTIEDLNLRCLEMVDRWTDHKIFNQRLAGIGKQLSDALKSGISGLENYLQPKSHRRQIVIVADGEGLKIPFELLSYARSHLATAAAVSRQLTNHHLPPTKRVPFHQLINRLKSQMGTLRVLLVGSDPQTVLSNVETELSAIRTRVEAGCRRINLKVEFVEILPAESTAMRLEEELINRQPYHLLHFTGHARHSSEDADASGLVMRGEDGEPEVVGCNRLNRWMENTDLWLVYLSSCHSSAVSGSGNDLSQRFLGTIEAIVAAGVPNIVGFRWLVSDQSAFHLADEFYRQLFEVQSEKNLSLAMLEARRAVERRPDFFDAWASSMLITQYS